MKDSKSKVLRRMVSLGLAASFLPGVVNVVGFNRVYGASGEESSFVEAGEVEEPVGIANTEFLGASESGYLGIDSELELELVREATERKKEVIRRVIDNGGFIEIYTERQYIFLVNEMNKVYRAVEAEYEKNYEKRRDLGDKMWRPFQDMVISLQADLDMRGEECPVIERFAGKFYGNNKTIRNVKIGNGLIKTLNGDGLVSGLRIEGITMEYDEIRFLERVAVIQNMYDESFIGDITVEGVNVKVVSNVGGTLGVIVGRMNTSGGIKNIKVCDVKIEVGEMGRCGRVGIIAGEINEKCVIDNIVVKRVDIEVKGDSEGDIGVVAAFSDRQFLLKDVTIDGVKIKVCGEIKRGLSFGVGHTWYGFEFEDGGIKIFNSTVDVGKVSSGSGIGLVYGVYGSCYNSSEPEKIDPNNIELRNVNVKVGGRELEKCENIGYIYKQAPQGCRIMRCAMEGSVVGSRNVGGIIGSLAGSFIRP